MFYSLIFHPEKLEIKFSERNASLIDCKDLEGDEVVQINKIWWITNNPKSRSTRFNSTTIIEIQNWSNWRSSHRGCPSPDRDSSQKKKSAPWRSSQSITDRLCGAKIQWTKSSPTKTKWYKSIINTVWLAVDLHQEPTIQFDGSLKTTTLTSFGCWEKNKLCQLTRSSSTMLRSALSQAKRRFWGPSGPSKPERKYSSTTDSTIGTFSTRSISAPHRNDSLKLVMTMI